MDLCPRYPFAREQGQMWGGTPWANSESRVGVDVGGYTMGKQ